MDLLWRIWNRPHGVDKPIGDKETNNTKLLPELSIPLNRSDQDADSTETFDNHGAFACTNGVAMVTHLAVSFPL